MESAPQFIWAGPMYVLSKPDDNPYDSPKEVATKSKGRVRLRLRNGCVLDFESHGRLIFGSTKSRVNCKNRWCCLITPIIHEETTIEAITGGHRGWPFSGFVLLFLGEFILITKKIQEGSYKRKSYLINIISCLTYSICVYLYTLYRGKIQNIIN